jgi:hypothetical protein
MPSFRQSFAYAKSGCFAAGFCSFANHFPDNSTPSAHSHVRTVAFVGAILSRGTNFERHPLMKEYLRMDWYLFPGGVLRTQSIVER